MTGSMKSRKVLHCTPCAQATKLVELLDEAKNRCKSTIKERRGDDITDEELESSSSIMGYGAIKYADLKNNRKTDYKQVSAAPLPHPLCPSWPVCVACARHARCSPSSCLYLKYPCNIPDPALRIAQLACMC